MPVSVPWVLMAVDQIPAFGGIKRQAALEPLSVQRTLTAPAASGRLPAANQTRLSFSPGVLPQCFGSSPAGHGRQARF